ncbi:MAG: ABC-2 family transporter protein [Anaerolineales bacterium]|nr:ABC-2 family transporter protein [Anaerolineales bacterium]
MRLFYEMTKRSWQRYLTYRAATLAGLVTNFFFGLLRAAILVALYGARQEVDGLTVQGVITYTAVTQALIAYLSFFGWTDLMDSVHSGEVAADLLKPMNFIGFWMARDLGRAMIMFLLRGVTLIMVYTLVFDLIVPETAVQWCAFFIALVLAWLVSFAWRFLINLAAFWTPNALGIGRFGFMLAWFFSGMIMPLPLFPDWIQKIAYLTPFPYMLDVTAEIFIGTLSSRDITTALTLQALWGIGLLLVNQIVLRVGVRRLVILGG